MGLFGPPDIEKLKSKRDIDRLIEAIGYQKDLKIRIAAARALGSLADTRAARPLRDLICNKYLESHLDLLNASAEALGEIGGKDAIDALIYLTEKTCIDNTRTIAGNALVKIGLPAIIPLMAAWTRNGNYNLYMVLKKIGMPCVKPLCQQMLLISNDNIRSDAARLLGEIGDSSAVGTLILASSDPNMGVRRMAVHSLGMIGDPVVVDKLVGIFTNKVEDISLRVEAAKSLLRLGWNPKSSGLEAAFWAVNDQWDKCMGSDMTSLVDDIRIISRVFPLNTDVLIKLGGISIEPLITLLVEGSDKKSICEALAAIGGSKAARALIDAHKRSKGSDLNVLESAMLKICDSDIEDYFIGLFYGYRSDSAQRYLAEKGSAKSLKLVLDAYNSDLPQNPKLSFYNDLEKILERNLSEITVEDLKAVTSIKGFKLYEYVNDTGDADGGGYADAGELDCSPVISLAQEELKRRGIDR